MKREIKKWFSVILCLFMTIGPGIMPVNAFALEGEESDHAYRYETYEKYVDEINKYRPATENNNEVTSHSEKEKQERLKKFEEKEEVEIEDQQIIAQEQKTQEMFLQEIQTKETVVYEEIEPNNNMEQANLVDGNYTGSVTYHIRGTITDYYFDLDFFRFDVPVSGTFDASAFWGAGSNWWGYGWENDLAIVLKDSTGDNISFSYFQDFGSGLARQKLEKDVAPGTYYLVIFQTSDYEYLYTNEPYALFVDFEADTEIQPDKYTLTVDTSGQGTTEPFEGTHEYEAGEAVTITAAPADGWEFDEWIIDRELDLANNVDEAATIYEENLSSVVKSSVSSMSVMQDKNNQDDRKDTKSRGRASKVEPLSAGETEVLILLKDQADTEKAALEARANQLSQRGTEQEKFAVRAKVVEALQTKAQEGQASLLRYLHEEKNKGRVTEIKSYYIVNLVYARVAEELVDTIAQRPEVEDILPNEKIELMGTITEPAIEVSSALESDQWNINRVNAPEVWNRFGVDGTDVVVGVIDTGVDWEHEALKTKYRGYDPANPGTPDHTYNWFDPYYGQSAPDDWEGHGTHCAGTVLGSTPDGQNQIGVAPGAQWIAARGLEDEGFGLTSYLLAAMEYMLAPTDSHGTPNPAMAPDIVNNSWGSAAECDPIYKSAIQSWRSAGILPVFAAGNDGPDTSTIAIPAYYEESFAVGSININNNLSDYSSRGPGACGTFWKPDISAPGEVIRSAQSEDPRQNRPRGYAYGSGTSMAAPHVAGAAALYLQDNPSASPQELFSAISGETTKGIITSSNTDNNHLLFIEAAGQSNSSTRIATRSRRW